VQSNATALWRSDDGGAVLGVRTWEGPRGGRRRRCSRSAASSAPRLTLGASVEQAGRLSEMAYDDLRDDLRAAGVAPARREIGVAGDAVTPPYRVEHDAVDPASGAPLERDGREVVGAGRSRRWPELWWLGAVTGDVGLEAAAAAGRDLARHLARVHRCRRRLTARVCGLAASAGGPSAVSGADAVVGVVPGRV
jgi:hypothetical protein